MGEKRRGREMDEKKKEEKLGNTKNDDGII